MNKVYGMTPHHRPRTFITFFIFLFFFFYSYINIYIYICIADKYFVTKLLGIVSLVSLARFEGKTQSKSLQEVIVAINVMSVEIGT